MAPPCSFSGAIAVHGAHGADQCEVQLVAGSWYAGCLVLLGAGGGCGVGDGAQSAGARVTPGLMCWWGTEFEPTADTVSENTPSKLGSIDAHFTPIFSSKAGMLCEGVVGPRGIEDFAANGLELVAGRW